MTCIPTLRARRVAVAPAVVVAALLALPAVAQTAPEAPAPAAQPAGAPGAPIPGMPMQGMPMPGMPMPPSDRAAGTACPMGGAHMMHGMHAMQDKPGTIQVTGEGQAAAAPDLAVVTVGVTVQAATAAEAMSGNAARQQAVIAALKAAGVEGRDVQTNGLTLSPQTDYKEGQAPVVRGYQASNIVTARLRAMDKLGPTIDALVGAGANEIQGIAFLREDAAATEADARRAAVASARTRAEVVAAAAGQRLGRLIAISDAGTSVSPQPVMMRMAAEATGGATPVERGEVTTTASVQATWELVPADAPKP